MGQSKKINYKVRISEKAKRLRIAVYCNGNVLVTRPAFVTNSVVKNIVDRKSGWIRNKLAFFNSLSSRRRINTQIEYIQLKDEALDFVKKKIEELNSVYGFSFNKIAIKNQKTRWGSCSKRGNLNFNYRIIHLPEYLIDYIIVHEICHLKEFNHSKRFWLLVSKSQPNYLALRNELKKTGIKFI